MPEIMHDEEIIQLENEIATLRKELQSKEEKLCFLKTSKQEVSNNNCNKDRRQDLSSEEITRYSRQMIMSQITTTGQLKLKGSKVLIVGAGGLGSPASLYLVAAGVGQVHIIDYDAVELSNLHRQILHTEDDIGVAKTASAFNKLSKVNKNVSVVPWNMHVDSQNIMELIGKHKYDVLIDCSDNMPTRYLLNDICVMNNIPLVYGSALKMEGQLTVYNYNGGPCLRCLFPVPPPAFAVTSCGDGGVLGPVPGTIGILQALQTIKILTESKGVLSGFLLHFDACETSFLKVKLRNRSAKCDVCGENPKITSPTDYEQFCGARSHDKVVNIDILAVEEQVEATELKNSQENVIVVDVRPELEFAMCKLPNSINLPYSKIIAKEGFEELEDLLRGPTKLVYVLCRRGNDSQRAMSPLKERFSHLQVQFKNVVGGLHSYSKLVEPSFPVY